MKILLRHKVNGLFLEAPGMWTDQAEQALDFRFTDRAINYAGVWNLQDVELAFVWDEPIALQTMALPGVALAAAA